MSAERVLEIWKFYVSLEGRRREILQQSRSARPVDGSMFETFWIVEGIYHLAYSVKRIAERRGVSLFDSDKIIPLIEEASDKISKFVSQRPGISFYRLFRTAATKEGLFESLFEFEQGEFSFS